MGVGWVGNIVGENNGTLLMTLKCLKAARATGIRLFFVTQRVGVTR